MTDIQNFGGFDPFQDAEAEDGSASNKNYVHVRVQQRNGRKSLTTVQGLQEGFDYKKVLKAFKKVRRKYWQLVHASPPVPYTPPPTHLQEFCCNGTVVEDPELGQVSGESCLGR
mmetsp:Transcript_1859/g.6660  ORF Transcript_1859/g.6660 Transcript_1859/m.6660 type:complete len:114 (-) Transcript_1859:537-878(-)